MSTFSALEHIQSRVEDAVKRLNLATQNLQRAQQEHQTATHEHAIWIGALQIEQRKAAQAQAQSQAQVQVHAAAHPQTQTPQQIRALNPTPVAPGVVGGTSLAETKAAAVVAEAANAASQDVNKTEAIRELLRKNSTGMSPAEIWASLKDQVDRAYVYAVLKRLKDRKQITTRRGKYYLTLTQKAEEGGAKQQSLLQ